MSVPYDIEPPSTMIRGIDLAKSSSPAELFTAGERGEVTPPLADLMKFHADRFAWKAGIRFAYNNRCNRLIPRSERKDFRCGISGNGRWWQ